MATETGRNRSDWLQAAFQALREGGVEAVKVEPLARRLGLTKGSFYWHFRDREALLAALLEEWENRAGARILARLDAAGRTPEERLDMLLETVIREGRNAVDPAVRAWALTDGAVADRVARVDAVRLAWLAGLFRSLGEDEAAAATRARLAYLALIGEHALRSAATPAERLTEARRALAIVTGAAGN